MTEWLKKLIHDASQADVPTGLYETCYQINNVTFEFNLQDPDPNIDHQIEVLNRIAVIVIKALMDRHHQKGTP